MPRWVNNGTEIIYNINDQHVVSTSIAVKGNQISVGDSKVLFKLDAGFQTNILSVSKDGRKILVKRTLNTQTLKSASVIFNWQKIVEKK
jgi:hypothetical protein